MPDSLGYRLRTLRTQRGMSQTDLARDIVSASYVSLIEAGKRVPDRAVIAQLAARLETSLDYLETGLSAADVEANRLAMRYAELALANGEPVAALDQFRQLARDGRAEIAAESTWGIVRALEAQGDLDGAIVAVESLLDGARANGNQVPGLLVLLNSQCWLYRQVGDLNYSIELGERALREAGELGLAGTEEEIRLATTLVGCYRDRGDLTRAHLLAQEVIEKAERHGSGRARGVAYWKASLIADGRGERHLAIHLAERALALLGDGPGEGSDEYGLAKMQMLLARLLLRLTPPDLARAEQILARSAEVMKVLGIEREIALCEAERALVRLLQGRPAEAAGHALGAIERLDPAHPIDLSRANLIYAQALVAAGDTRRGIEQLRQARGLAGGAVPRPGQAQLWRDIADTFASLGQLDDALAGYRQLADNVGTQPSPTANPRPQPSKCQPAARVGAKRRRGGLRGL